MNYLKVGAKTKTIPLLRSRSNKFMISVAMKITIKSINGVYELHYEARMACGAYHTFDLL